jgi:hypothetical protein
MPEKTKQESAAQKADKRMLCSNRCAITLIAAMASVGDTSRLVKTSAAFRGLTFDICAIIPDRGPSECAGNEYVDAPRAPERASCPDFSQQPLRTKVRTEEKEQ